MPVTEPSKPKVIVVELWGLGDLVIATPFLQAASRKYSVTLLAKPFAEDLRPRLWPDIRVVSFVAPWTAFHHKYRVLQWPWRKFFRLRWLRKERFDVGLSARWDPRDHHLLLALRTRQRFGFPRTGSQFLLTKPLSQPGPAAHRFAHWRVLAEAMGLELPVPVPIGSSLPRPVGEILIHTGAGQPIRIWPLDRYRELVARLRQHHYRVQVVCDPGQHHWWVASGEATVATPRSVTELMGLIDRAGAFIGNDSGPGHLAAFLGVPTFTIFGPQLPARFVPLHPAAEWVDGKPCPFKPCLDYCQFEAPHCLWNLSTDEVWAKVEIFANRHRAALITAEPAPINTLAYHTPRPRRFIQVFCRYLMRGGEETSVARIARHLEWGGHKVIRFWRASAEWKGINRPHLWKQILLAWNNQAVLSQLREKHLRFKPDAWIFHNIVPVVSLGAYRLARELNAPIIAWIHNHRPISPSGTMFAGGRMLQPEDRWLAWKEAWHGTWHGQFATAGLALAYAKLKQRGDFDSVKAWVAISEEMRETFLRANFPAEKLHCLHHSWDIHPPLDLKLDQGYFLFLGRMTKEKGVRFLVELWQRPELKDIQLVMAGEGQLADEYRKKTPPNIRWAGFVEGAEKHRLVAGCRAVLLPCLAPEALGLVVYEAYEQGKPVLGSAMGGLKDVIQHGTTGRLLPPGDDAAWIEAILEHARNADLSHERGRHGLEWLEATVSPSAWNRKFDAILSECVP